MRVARAFKQDPVQVAAQPFALTAWAHLQLLDVEHFAELERDAEGLREASRITLAFHDPKKLEHESFALQQRAERPLWREQESIAAATARGLALAQRIARGGVMLS